MTLIKRFKNIKFRAIQAKSIIQRNFDNLLFPSVHICVINVNYLFDLTGKRIFSNWKLFSLYKEN